MPDDGFQTPEEFLKWPIETIAERSGSSVEETRLRFKIGAIDSNDGEGRLEKPKKNSKPTEAGSSSHDVATEEVTDADTETLRGDSVDLNNADLTDSEPICDDSDQEPHQYYWERTDAELAAMHGHADDTDTNYSVATDISSETEIGYLERLPDGTYAHEVFDWLPMWEHASHRLAVGLRAQKSRFPPPGETRRS